ncbi:hypothetical protein DENSPDRAFT_886810 [Dentipellis sp. KUC8613]|nr:hypothetical protein DENSPDRAFT_886810 [Dentipellis sp. KUC8613]
MTCSHPPRAPAPLTARQLMLAPFTPYPAASFLPLCPSFRAHSPSARHPSRPTVNFAPSTPCRTPSTPPHALVHARPPPFCVRAVPLTSLSLSCRLRRLAPPAPPCALVPPLPHPFARTCRLCICARVPLSRARTPSHHSSSGAAGVSGLASTVSPPSTHLRPAVTRFSWVALALPRSASSAPSHHKHTSQWCCSVPRGPALLSHAFALPPRVPSSFACPHCRCAS